MPLEWLPTADGTSSRAPIGGLQKVRRSHQRGGGSYSGIVRLPQRQFFHFGHGTPLTLTRWMITLHTLALTILLGAGAFAWAAFLPWKPYPSNNYWRITGGLDCLFWSSASSWPACFVTRSS